MYLIGMNPARGLFTKAQMKQGEYHKAVDAEAQNLLSSEGKK